MVAQGDKEAKKRHVILLANPLKRLPFSFLFVGLIDVTKEPLAANLARNSPSIQLVLTPDAALEKPHFRQGATRKRAEHQVWLESCQRRLHANRSVFGASVRNVDVRTKFTSTDQCDLDSLGSTLVGDH